MLVYRIVHNIYSKNLFASGIKGRWNFDGKKVIYAAESIALAFLENMIRRQGVGFNKDFKIMIIEIPENTKTTIVDTLKLKGNWRDSNDYFECQVLGEKWYTEGKTLILKAPSAVLPESFNYVINTTHPDYKQVKLIDITDLVPDQRIEEILKNYSKK